MSGVSITSGGDIDLLLGSNENFQQRMTEMRQTKAQLDQAINDLNLGKEAKAAYGDAKALKDRAARERAEEYEKLQADMARMRNEIQAWVATTQADASERLAQAQNALVSAKSAEAAAQAKEAEAAAVLDRRQKDADDIVAKATFKADAILAEAKEKADAATAEADKHLAAAKAIELAAISMRSDYEARLAKLKAAMA